MRKILTTRVGLLKRLAGSTWGAGATTLSTATLALVNFAAEYCLPVWYRSAHTRLIIKLINNALRIVTGCLRPTPIDNLFVLADIDPTELRRKQAVLSLACRAQGPERIFNKRLLFLSYKRHLQLKLRHPFVPSALELLKVVSEPVWHVGKKPNGIRNGKVTPPVNVLSSATSNPKLLGMYLLRSSWVRLNRLRTGVGLFRSTVHRWGMASTAACECGAEEQTADHIIISCPIFYHPIRRIGLETVDEETLAWLINICPKI